MSSKTQKFFFSTQPRAILERENDAGDGPVPPLRAGKEDTMDDLNHQAVMRDLRANLRAILVQARIIGNHAVHLGLERLDAVGIHLGLIGAARIDAGTPVGAVRRLRAPP